MSTQPYLVLRSTRPQTHHSIESIFGQPYGTDSATVSKLKIEKIDLSSRESEDLRATEDVISIAPIIPLHHISPAADATEPEQVPAGSSWGLQAVGADQHRLTGAGVVVAVLDTGIDAEHPAFSHLQGRIEQRNFTDESAADLTGHGTHCAGTIFGGTVNGIRIGIAPGIRKALIGKVVGGEASDTSAVCEALQWAVDGGASIISLSLGFDVRRYADQLATELPPDVAFSRALLAYHDNLELFSSFAQKVVALRGRQVLLAAAAGNDSRRHEKDEYVIHRMLPAAASGFLAVGALQKSGNACKVAPFSNTGVRVVAPGVRILSALPGNRFGRMSGTSTAVPHVCGVAALWQELLQQQSRTVSGQLLQDRLLGSCSYETIAEAREADVGAGLVQAPR